MQAQSIRLLATASVCALLTAGAASAQSAGAGAADSAAAVEAVIVTGSRLATAGFQAPTPVTVVGAAQVEQRAPASIGEVVNQIPAFRNTSSPATSTFGIVASGQSILDLRGLGANRTLVLVNGMRHVPVNSNGTFDTNMLPTSLVDRFEVVTGGASAAYGSDAVAGVTNFILKNRLEGLTGSAQYGITQRGDGVETFLSLGYGRRFAQGKGHFIIGGDYAENSGVNSQYSRSWGRREPGVMALPITRTAGLPSQIFSDGVELAARTPGGIITTGPLKGTSFDANGQPYAFQYGSIVGAAEQIGSSNYRDAEYAEQQLYVPYERGAVLARAEYELTPDTTAYASLHYGSLQTHTNTLYIPTSPAIPISRDNIFLPTATRNAMIANNLQTITVGRTGREWGNIVSGNRLETLQANFGVNGKVFETWNWDVGGTLGKTHSTIALKHTPRTADLYSSFYAVAGPNGQPVCGPAATNPYFLAQPVNRRAELLTQISPGCVPFNIFGPNKGSQASVDYFLSTSSQAVEIKQRTVQANLSGEPFNMPAGPVSVAVGAEWRKDTIDAIGCPDCVAKKLENQNYPTYAAGVTVKEAYAEVGVPLLRDLTFFKTLDLNAAVRRADYSTSGGVTTWKVGGTWDVNDMVRLRATRSRDIRAPNISELFDPGSNGKGNVTNRLTGVSGIVDNRTAGNPNLTPEIADTFTAGLVFQPTWSWASGFRASIDYYTIDIADVLGSVPQQETADRCLVQKLQEFCAFVAFDNSVLGFSGVYATRVNLAAQKTNGVDLEFAYRAPIDMLKVPGTLNIRALGTWVDDIRTIQVSSTGVVSDIDIAGAVNAFGGAAGVPEWSWNLNFAYVLNRFSSTLQARYNSDVKYSTVFIGPDDKNYSPALSNSVNRNTWSESLYWNLNAAYNIIDTPDRRLQVFGLIDNLFDKDPPVVALEIKGGNPYDLLGRRFKLGVRFTY